MNPVIAMLIGVVVMTVLVICTRMRAAAAGAVLKPQGGNCAVVPKR